AMTADRTSAGSLRVRWDVRSCTARDYNLFFGDLPQVASYAYTGADCGLGTSGTAIVPMPSTASGSAWFVVASEDGAGNEGPHGDDGSGAIRPATGVGFCGITAQIPGATCP